MTHGDLIVISEYPYQEDTSKSRWLSNLAASSINRIWRWDFGARSFQAGNKIGNKLLHSSKTRILLCRVGEDMESQLMTRILLLLKAHSLENFFKTVS